MGTFNDQHGILDEFLVEACDLLADVDAKLVLLEKAPGDAALLNDIFRGFHTIKGGAGFLEATPLVECCHLTESLLDQLRAGQRELTAVLLDLILAATSEVRRMFDELAARQFPTPAAAALLARLEATVSGSEAQPEVQPAFVAHEAPVAGEPDWAALYAALIPAQQAAMAAAPRPSSSTVPPPGAKDSSIRVETARFDKILNLTGEIGLATNRLTCLRTALSRAADPQSLMRPLDATIAQLDMLVDDLQSMVMKARMQPVGKMFQKYSRMARDVARSLGKEVDFVLVGEETEVDKTILDEINDPLVHLVRNAIDHGVELPAEREAAGKQRTALVRLSARQAGDRLVLEIADDGRGMEAGRLRAKAVEKGLILPAEAAAMSEREALELIFLPGFSTKDQVSDLSGRGVGMDVVRTNIRRLSGRVEIQSQAGQGSVMTITLPLSLAILPVLMVRLGQQPLALPLGSVQEIIALDGKVLQSVSGRPVVALRGNVLPFYELASLLGRERADRAEVGVVLTCGADILVIGVDGFLGQDEVMIKPIEGVKPAGVAGATQSGNGDLVLLLELSELLAENQARPGRPASGGAPMPPSSATLTAANPADYEELRHVA